MTREEWAERRRSTACGQNPNPASQMLGAYASAAEIDAAIAAMVNVWKDYGRQMRDSDDNADDLRWYRRGINRVIKEMCRGFGFVGPILV